MDNDYFATDNDALIQETLWGFYTGLDIEWWFQLFQPCLCWRFLFWCVLELLLGSCPPIFSAYLRLRKGPLHRYYTESWWVSLTSPPATRFQCYWSHSRKGMKQDCGHIRQKFPLFHVCLFCFVTSVTFRQLGCGHVPLLVTCAGFVWEWFFEWFSITATLAKLFQGGWRTKIFFQK